MKSFDIAVLGATVLGCLLASTALGNPSVKPRARQELTPAAPTKASAAPAVVRPGKNTPSVTAPHRGPAIDAAALARLKAPKALSDGAMSELLAKASGLDVKQVRARGIERKVRLTPRRPYQEGQAYLRALYPSEYDPHKDVLVLEQGHNGSIGVNFMPDKVDVPYLITVGVSTIGGKLKQKFTWNTGGTEQTTIVRRGTHNISVTVTPTNRSWQSALFYLGGDGHAFRVHHVDVHAMR